MKVDKDIDFIKADLSTLIFNDQIESKSNIIKANFKIYIFYFLKNNFILIKINNSMTCGLFRVYFRVSYVSFVFWSYILFKHK